LGMSWAASDIGPAGGARGARPPTHNHAVQIPLRRPLTLPI
jgi:hypothetical protein